MSYIYEMISWGEVTTRNPTWSSWKCRWDEWQEFMFEGSKLSSAFIYKYQRLLSWNQFSIGHSMMIQSCMSTNASKGQKSTWLHISQKVWQPQRKKCLYYMTLPFPKAKMFMNPFNGTRKHLTSWISH